MILIFHLRLGLSKAALAALIVGNRLVERLFIEVRPVGIAEIELRICYLPEQIVAYAQLATSAYQQLWVGHKTCLQALRDKLLTDLLGVELSFGGIGSNTSYSVGNFPF